MFVNKRTNLNTICNIMPKRTNLRQITSQSRYKRQKRAEQNEAVSSPPASLTPDWFKEGFTYSARKNYSEDSKKSIGISGRKSGIIIFERPFS